ncbi:substrate-binding domain-containing protein [Spirillospora sp. NBC_00431]
MRIGKTKLYAASVAALTLAALTTVASPATAEPPPNGTAEVIAFAGSDTTEDVLDALTTAYRGNTAANPDGDNTVNIPVQAEAGSPAFNVPAQGACTSARNYVHKLEANQPSTYPAPNGSTDGKNALQGNAPFPSDNLTTGCIDGGRSSSGPSRNDPATFEYYAYALDAVSWAHYETSAAPASLSEAEIQGIYDCTYTNWNQVGGEDAPIHRYIPQSGSGTRSFFIGTVLAGAEPSTACGPVTEIQEHDGRAVPTGDRYNAILPYSVAQWVAQANNVVDDKRGTVVVGHQENAAGVQNPVSGPDGNGKYTPDTGIVTEDSEFLGVRYVYNVLDSRIPSYGQALRFAGQDGSGPGYLCDGNSQVTGILTDYGFSPLEPDPITGEACRLS